MGNYNLKNILLGIGIGLVAASMINISMSSREMTVEEIKQEAAKHSLIVLTKEEILNNNTTPGITSPEEPSPTEEPTPTPTAAPTEPAAAIIKVEVKSGMTSESIANLLKERGVIKDTDAFRKRLGELKMDSRLKVGNFDIPKDSGYDEIIRILTK